MNFIGGSDSFCGDFMMLWEDVNLVRSPAEALFEDCAGDAVPARRNKNKCHDHYKLDQALLVMSDPLHWKL